jgi:hypothetical protein
MRRNRMSRNNHMKTVNMRSKGYSWSDIVATGEYAKKGVLEIIISSLKNKIAKAETDKEDVLLPGYRAFLLVLEDALDKAFQEGKND